MMGSGEMDSSAKGSKTPSSQEQASTTSGAAGYPEWAGFQAYSPIPPPGFFHPTMASSLQAHPYMWVAQQFMPPYGTPPPPYVAMYPHGGLYPHPSVPLGSYPFSPYAMPSPNGNAEASGAMLGGMETDGKSTEAKGRSPLKKSKGSLGTLNLLMGKNNNKLGKASGAPANGLSSQSGDSASECSSEGSDANSHNDSQQKKPCRQDSEEAEASQNGSAACDHQNGVDGPPNTSLNLMIPIMPMPAHCAPGSVTGPATTLNIGMDHWGGPTASPMRLLRGKVPAIPPHGAVIPTGLVGPGNPSDLWDERELKRQRRKQSNRESARRSRLRKQAECKELAQQVIVLREENSNLVSEMSHIRDEYEQLVAENTSLKDRLGESPRVHEDSRSIRKDQPSSIDDHPRHRKSGVQAGRKELA